MHHQKTEKRSASIFLAANSHLAMNILITKAKHKKEEQKNFFPRFFPLSESEPSQIRVDESSSFYLT